MAGIMPGRSASGRKQWNVTDDHCTGGGSLKLLRNHLANEGCPNSQVVLAKQLFTNSELSNSDREKAENEKLGVYWLLKASEQGNVEATDLLKNCLENGRGISEYNYLDVKSCIMMTQQEKLSRWAAKEIFANLSDGGDYITSMQLQREILAIQKCGVGSSSQELANNDPATLKDWETASSPNNEKLTEENLINAAVDFAHGQLPKMTEIMCLTAPDPKPLKHLPLIYKSVLHPLLVLTLFYWKTIRCLSRTLNIQSEVRFGLVLVGYSLFHSGDLLTALPAIFYYLSFGLMTVTTCEMLQNRTRDLYDFRLWSGLFLCYSGGRLDAEEVERLYIKNNLKPYGKFFIALLVNLLLYSTLSENWVPNSEITIVSFCLTFITLVSFLRNPGRRRNQNSVRGGTGWLVLLSFAVNVLAKYPYEADAVVSQGWRFLDLDTPTFVTYVVGNGIEFCLNFRLLLYAVIPLLFVSMASRNSWRGTYETLVPHCVTLGWLQICLIGSRAATTYGLARGVLALVGVVMFLPLVGLTTVLLPAIAIVKWVYGTLNPIACITLAASSAVFLIISRAVARTKLKHYTAVIQIVLAIIAVATLITSESFDNGGEHVDYLTREAFQKLCNFEHENTAVTQIRCAELEASPVHWEGYVTGVKLKNVKNSYKKLIKVLPRRLSRQLTNYFNLEKYNKYTFEITIQTHSGLWEKPSDIILEANNLFKNFSTGLTPEDHIWFKGTLFNYEPDGILGGSKPHITVEEIGCLNCRKNLTDVINHDNNPISIDYILNYLYTSLKFIVNVLINPVIILK